MLIITIISHLKPGILNRCLFAFAYTTVTTAACLDVGSRSKGSRWMGMRILHPCSNPSGKVPTIILVPRTHTHTRSKNTQVIISIFIFFVFIYLSPSYVLIKNNTEPRKVAWVSVFWKCCLKGPTQSALGICAMSKMRRELAAKKPQWDSELPQSGVSVVLLQLKAYFDSLDVYD